MIGVHIRTVHSWIERGMIVPSQAYKGESKRRARRTHGAILKEVDKDDVCQDLENQSQLSSP